MKISICYKGETKLCRQIQTILLIFLSLKKLFIFHAKRGDFYDFVSPVLQICVHVTAGQSMA